MVIVHCVRKVPTDLHYCHTYVSLVGQGELQQLTEQYQSHSV